MKVNAITRTISTTSIDRMNMRERPFFANRLGLDAFGVLIKLLRRTGTFSMVFRLSSSFARESDTRSPAQ